MLIESLLRQAVQKFDLVEHAERLDDRERDASLGVIVMVIGAGNFGKSSLINALCGQVVAPVSVIPKTFKIDVFTDGNPGTALVRFVGEHRPIEYSTQEARTVEVDVERRFSSKDQKKLAEIIWRFDDLTLPHGISLVDTPGISQALGKAAKSVSLASVLGSTFEVDEVWARWFHRADLVIWAFCANKMEDADTRAALESALNLFDKPVIPVATKADLVPVERWPEIHERFNTIYGPLLRERQAGELHLTVCGGKNADLSGTGISELRESLARVASEALAIKRYAQDAFLRDESASVSNILDETARTLVSNLRAIASLGDALAEEAVNEANRGRLEAISRVNSYLGGIRRDPKLGALAKAVYDLTKGGRAGDAEAEARARLIELIDENRIERDVNEAFAECARSLEATADRLSQGIETTTLTFKSSGKVTRQAVPIHLKLKAFAVTSQLEFAMRLESPSGFFGTAWDAIKRLFGLDRFSPSDIQAAMSSALAIPDTELEEAMRQALYEGFAPALRTAVSSALREHIEATDAEATALLTDVDVYLPLLAPDGSPPTVTTYGPQAEYWASFQPAAETLLSLARQELTDLLPDFRTLLEEPFSFDPPLAYPLFGMIWKDRVTTQKSADVQIELPEVLRLATSADRPSDEGADAAQDAPFLPILLAAQHQALEEAPMILALDAHLAASVVGVRYQSAGSALAQAGAEAFESALLESPRVWKHSVSHERLWGWYFGKGTLLGTILAGMIGLAFLPVRRDLGFICVGIALIWLAIGFFRPYLEAYIRYRGGIAEAVGEEVRACQTDSAQRISSNTVEQVIAGMKAELAPRPLQRLLIASKLLEP